MFSTYAQTDPFNRNGKRNRSNTDTDAYNCGGFALGTYSWYVPYRSDEQMQIYERWAGIQMWLDVAEDADNIADRIDARETAHTYVVSLLNLFVKRILEDFPSVRRVQTFKEIKPDERIILFRTGADDFHFIVSFDHKHWWHKYGWNCIEELCEDEVLDTEWANGRYFSPIAILAMPND